MTELEQFIRTVPDFPKPGIGFKDITTLLKEPQAFRLAVEQLQSYFDNKGIQKIVGIESRGFLFAAPLALQLNAGLVPARKPGKLPAETVKEEYQLEYGTDAIEIHVDAIAEGERVAIVDDLLATGGTAAATARLVEKPGGQIAGLAFLIELDFLNGRRNLENYELYSLIHVKSE